MTGAAACDYHFTDAQAEMLMGTAALTAEFRRMLLARLTHDELVEMFAQFIGMANSVVSNNREMIEMALIIHGGQMPNQAEQINLPTIFGALSGARTANLVPPTAKTCSGCAYRLGTPANQSPVTTCDADWQRANDDSFWCHEDMNEDGSPKRQCVGHLVATKIEGEANGRA